MSVQTDRLLFVSPIFFVMTLVIWTLTVIALLVWTGTMALLAIGLAWLTDHASEVTASAVQITQWPVPPWLALWVDPQWVRWSQELAQQLLHWTQAALPWITPLLGWLVPAVWLVWGLGALVLLITAGTGHWLWRRSRRSRLPAV